LEYNFMQARPVICEKPTYKTHLLSISARMLALLFLVFGKS
jgi:hypothetical protein